MKKKSAKKRRPSELHQQKKSAQKIRIGYISDAFGAGGARRDFLTAFCAGHDPQSFQVYAYHMGCGGDTKRFEEAVHAFRALGELTLDEAVQTIQKDGLDILVDTSPHMPQERIREILERCPARHIVSLAEECPPEVAVPLPEVAENKGFLPYCYAPIQPLTDYVYRAPILDCGIPGVGFVGHAYAGMREQMLTLLKEMLARIPRIRLMIPAALAEGLTEEDFARIGEMGTETAELHLVDEPIYELLDIVIGVGADISDICHTAERGVPLLTAEPLVHTRFAVSVLAALNITEHLPADAVELAAQADELLCDTERLSELHGLLCWRMRDSSLCNTGAYMFTLERAYSRVLYASESARAEEHIAAFQRAAAAEDWPRVVQLAHILDGCGCLASEHRMSLAWAYFFLNRHNYAGRWALAADGLPPEREGARLYLSATGENPPGSAGEIFARAKEGLRQIEAGIISASPDIHVALLRSCANFARLEGCAVAAEYASAYVRKEHDKNMARLYYGASLLFLNAVDVSPEEIYRRSCGYREFFSDVRQYSHKGRRRKDKIRIGYISGDFRRHVMQYFLWPFLAGYDADTFEVYAYNLGAEDEYTKTFQTFVTRWRDVMDCKGDMEKIAQRIYADEIDILFDLAGHTADSGLAALAWKPAPIQLSGLGYMATTGLPAVDYFVTDRYCDPPETGSEVYFVEKLLRLTSQFCYNGYTNLPRSTGTPARRTGFIQFASFNQYRKLTDDMVRAWAEIMRRIPTSRLLLKNNAYGHVGTVQHAYKRMEQCGLDMSRVTFEGATKDYMSRYLDVDIALDTFPWPGGGTTCDALYMGVPVVSYYTERHSTRFSYSLLANIGLADLASERLEDYVETAVALAGNIELLDALHRELRERMKASPVMDQVGYIREMEAAYKEIWERYLYEETQEKQS